MSTPAGWYPQPDGQQRYWDGQQWTEHFAPGIPAETTSLPPLKMKTEQATTDGRSFNKAAWFGWGGLALAFLLGALSSGFSGAVIMLGLFALVVGVIALARGRVGWARLGSRAAGGVAIGAAMALLTVGAIAAPSTSPTGGSATTSSETPTVADAAAEAAAQAADKAAAELAAANQAATDQAAAEVAAADKAAADKAAAEKAAADKVVADKKAAADKVVADKAAAVKAAADKAAADKAAAAKKIADANRLTTAQENAKRKAESYLDMSGFSRSGLIDQLKFEGFTENDAKRAIDSMHVNWNTEAEQKAKSYTEMSGFSRSGLIEQLRFEGFTNAQAAHGADSVGL